MLLILQIAVLLAFLALGGRIVVGVLRNSAIFNEFNQSRLLALFALLFPLGPVLLLATMHSVPLAVLGAASCYVPALVLSRRQLRAFEHAGTNRVKDALGVTYQAFGTAVAGLVYVGGAVAIGLMLKQL